MDEITITLTDAEYAEALRAGFDAATAARFHSDQADRADEIGIAASLAKAHELALRRLGR